MDKLLNNISLALAAYEYGMDVKTYAADHEYKDKEAQLRLEQCHTFKDLFSSLGFNRELLESIAAELE